MFNQDITQHKAVVQGRKNIKLSSKVTKRPFIKIMNKIKMKLLEKLQEKIGYNWGEDINVALADTVIEQ